VKPAPVEKVAETRRLSAFGDEVNNPREPKQRPASKQVPARIILLQVSNHMG
jgi:hypothetical protein